MNKVLLYLSFKYKGDWENIFQALNNKEVIERNKIAKLKSKIDNDFITIIDNEYPTNLKSVYKPPFLLFAKGNLQLLNKNLVSLFGEWTINEILNILDDKVNTCFILNFHQRHYQLMKKMEEHKINYMCISNRAINDKVFDIISNHNLVISEFIKENKDINPDQILERISIGISKKVLIKYKEWDIDMITGLEIGRIEEANLYYYKSCNQLLLDNFNLNKIERISKIFLNKN
ncbi:MAG: DNA-processing protein DprA [Mycoplasmoidaceae bacterium]